MKLKTPKEEEFVDGNNIHRNPDQHKTTRSFRDFPPAHFTLRMKSFMEFLHSGLDKYKSNVFEAGGYTWRLNVYPNGKTKTVKDHISLYLSIVHKDNKPTLPRGWEVYAISKFFVYDHIRNKYLIIQDSKGEPFRFHQTKTKWGFDYFLPLNIVKDSSNGYLREDCCVFGAEVFVVNYRGSGECLSTVKVHADSTYTWKFEKTSALSAGILFSEEFEVGGIKWYKKLSFCPEGHGTAQGKSVSLFLHLIDSKYPAKGKKMYVEHNLRIINQLDGTKNIEKTDKNWFFGGNSWGYDNFLALKDLNCKSSGYIVDDTIIAEAQITLICLSKTY